MQPGKSLDALEHYDHLGLKESQLALRVHDATLHLSVVGLEKFQPEASHRRLALKGSGKHLRGAVACECKSHDRQLGLRLPRSTL